MPHIPVFSRSPRPDLSKFPIRDSRVRPEHHIADLTAARRYWEGVMAHTEGIGDFGRQGLAQTIATYLREAVAKSTDDVDVDLMVNVRSGDTLGRIRRRILGGLAMARLGVALMAYPEIPIADARATNEVTMLTDMYEDAVGDPLPPALHYARERRLPFLPPSTRPNQWYYSRTLGLYVQKRPSDPTTVALSALLAHDHRYSVNFDSMDMLHPYVDNSGARPNLWTDIPGAEISGD